jgi:lambda repressor-like predicted transcriptional regulator
LASGDFLLGAMQEKSYISGMADPVRDLIRNEAERRGESLSSLSKKIGKNHAYLQQFLERGVPKSLPEDVRPDLAALLGVEESQLRNGTGNKGVKPKVKEVAGYRAPCQFSASAMFPFSPPRKLEAARWLSRQSR